MSLKFPFKFKHQMSNTVFFAEKEDNDTVKVSWDTEHFIDFRNYEMSLVEHFIDTGGWTIIGQPSPVVEISQDEYDSMVEEINLLQDLLADANNHIAELETKSKFKPVKDMTFEDWKEAKEKGYKFNTRRAGEVKVVELDRGSVWAVRTHYGWHRIDGTFNSDREEVAEDIIERISLRRGR